MKSTDNRAVGSFPETRWTLVSIAGQDQTVRSLAALNELLCHYLPALQTHLEHRLGLPPHRADDLLQSFVTEKILVKDLLKRAHRGRGRFRNFLLKSFNNFLADEIRKEKAKKRAPDALTNISLSEHEDRIAVAPEADLALNTAWAQQVIARTLEEVRTACASKGRLDIWGVFEGRILDPILSGRQPVAYEELAVRYGFETPLKAANALTTAKRGFRQALTRVIADTVADPAQIDEEIDDLIKILSESHPESRQDLRSNA